MVTSTSLYTDLFFLSFSVNSSFHLETQLDPTTISGTLQKWQRHKTAKVQTTRVLCELTRNG